MAETILAAGLFVFVAHFLEFVFVRTRIPDILMLMILGVVAGPVLGLVQLESLGQVGEFLSVVTLVVILTESGISLNIKTLVRAAGRATPFALFSMAGAVALMALLLSWLLGFDTWTSVLGAFILGGTSSAVVIPMLKGLKTSDQTTTVLTLESALTDVLCIIATVGIATGLAAGQQIETSGLLTNASVSLLLAMLLGVAAGAFWAVLISVAKRMRNAMFTTLAFALVVYGIAEVIEISGAIAALAFGVTLGNVPSGWTFRLGGDDVAIRHVGRTERRVYSEVVFLLKAFFFFYLGLTVRPEDFVSALGLVALVLALTPFVPRILAVIIFFPRTTARREALISWTLVPRGLAAAVLAQIPVQLGLAGAAELASTVAMMVFISIALVALFIFLGERGALDGFAGFVFARFEGPQTRRAPGRQGDPAATETSAGSAEAAPDNTVSAPKADASPPTPGEAPADKPQGGDG